MQKGMFVFRKKRIWILGHFTDYRQDILKGTKGKLPVNLGFTGMDLIRSKKQILFPKGVSIVQTIDQLSREIIPESTWMKDFLKIPQEHCIRLDT